MENKVALRKTAPTTATNAFSGVYANLYMARWSSGL